MRIRKAMAWVAFWIGLALLFNLGIYLLAPVVSPGADRSDLALKFFGGYIIELSLSIDNLFVFLVIFASFNVPAAHQRRVLNYGIIGAIVLRLVFILIGSALVVKFHWLLYVFGVLLILSAGFMLIKGDKEKDYKKSSLIKSMNKVIPFTGTLEGERFFVRRDGKLYATLLFAVLIIIESSDVIFNIDSIPAIFSITTDAFIVFTSNVFAIVGLRSFYFVLQRLSQMFRYVKYGVALIILFTGVKLLLPLIYSLFGAVHEQGSEDIIFSIGVIGVILLGSIFASILIKEKPQGRKHK